MRYILLGIVAYVLAAAVLAGIGAWGGMRVASRVGAPASDGAQAGMAFIGFLTIILSGNTRTRNFERRLRWHTMWVGGTVDEAQWGRDRRQRQKFAGSGMIVGALCWGYAAVLYLLSG